MSVWDKEIEQWRDESVSVTGSVWDRFTTAEMMQSFSAWLVFAGQIEPSLPTSVLLSRMTEAVRMVGIQWRPQRQEFRGGLLS